MDAKAPAISSEKLLYSVLETPRSETVLWGPCDFWTQKGKPPYWSGRSRRERATAQNTKTGQSFKQSQGWRRKSSFLTLLALCHPARTSPSLNPTGSHRSARTYCPQGQTFVVGRQSPVHGHRPRKGTSRARRQIFPNLIKCD